MILFQTAETFTLEESKVWKPKLYKSQYSTLKYPYENVVNVYCIKNIFKKITILRV